jgi:CheY-like chemotaxis protein
MARANILVVDDEPLIGEVFADYLTEQGFTVTVSPNAFQALELTAGTVYDLIFLDIRMPGMDGVDALEKMKALQPSARFILMTGYWDQTQHLQERALKIGIFACVEKPFDIPDLMPLIEKALADPPAG